ncbi:MAG TPA: class I SAM-dependent methyltransferase [Anaeromyxobacter sp.]|nr:class I SAM-dependent methyltransferase [Anaeromyxobacter sp.]
MPRLVRLAVTTPLRPDPLEVEAARGAAERHGLPYVARDGRGLSRVVAEVGAEAALVLSAGRAVLSSGGAEHAWSPGMGALRLRRYLDARAGRAADPTARDPFLDAAGIEPGDAVLDCTAGLGADALVAAAAAGPRGLVLALESSRALAAWTGEGLRRFPAEAARRVEVRCADHLEHLRSAAARSFDVVVFDPMFRQARAEPGGFEVVRRLSDPRPLSPEALAEARRVARRLVVVKDGAPGWDLARLGLTPLPSARGAHRYYARVAASG